MDKAIHRLKYKRQFRKYADVQPPEIVGLDTETIDGRAVLIADSFGRYSVIKEFNALLEFLTYHQYRGKLLVWYNLRYDFQAVIKWLPVALRAELNKWNEIIFEWGESLIRLKFIPKKVFTIQFGTMKWVNIKGKSFHKFTTKQSYSFFDVAQFFKMSLEKASSLYLNEHKNDEDSIISSYSEITEQYIQYCLKDAELCQRLGVYLSKMFERVGIVFKNPYSTASISKRYFMKNCDIPLLNDIPRQAWIAAYMSYHGGHFEVGARGHFPDAYSGDIVSAYPEEIANLIDINSGTWIRGTAKRAINDYYYCYVNCDLDLDKMYFNPIVHDLGVICMYPHGRFRNITITKNEYNFLVNNNLGRVRVHKYWGFEPDMIRQPFRKQIYHLFQTRSDLKKAGDPLEYGFKIAMNSFYGLFIQRILDKKTNALKTGNLFLPMYASEITANVRLKLAELALKYGESIISFATDGIFSTERLPFNPSTELGEWDYEGKGEAWIIGSGIYQFKFSDKDEVKNKFRGGSTKLNIIDMLENNPQSTKIGFEITRPLSLGEVHKISRYGDLDINPEMLNSFESVPKELNINFDRKRLWDREFENAKDVLTHSIYSQPLEMGKI